MLRYVVSATLILVSMSARAEIAEPAIGSVEIREVPLRGPMAQVNNSCGGTLAGAGTSAANPSIYGLLDLGLGDIITIGNTLWNIINAGKPVVTLETPEASALPRGITCWTDLDSWQPPVIHAYEVSYKSMFGNEVVKFGFALHYTYGGGHLGVGKYLANVTIMPTDLSVSWMYNFDASVEAEQAVNVGSAAEPVAGLELNLKWTIKTLAKQSVNTFTYFVQGDGLLKNDSPAM